MSDLIPCTDKGKVAKCVEIFKIKYISDPKWYKCKVLRVVEYDESECEYMLCSLHHYAHKYEMTELSYALDVIKPIESITFNEFEYIILNNYKHIVARIMELIIEKGPNCFPVEIDDFDWPTSVREKLYSINNLIYETDVCLWFCLNRNIDLNIALDELQILPGCKFKQNHIELLNKVFKKYANVAKRTGVKNKYELLEITKALHSTAKNVSMQGYKVQYKNKITSEWNTTNGLIIEEFYPPENSWVKYRICY
ncbi:Hypothetical protein PACV_306 [Pacmanvirus A23]|uniref:Hypothetical protein n=1 Tax=Pacmanvirus A23 TaxID=1932881 RepID=UPI000A093EFA|nr:Hypothetical protein B9W72_gp302 [Pacmanvirus A23]SIP86019.1 Hypothetical protein PACV_306 [Pacmanvirus A23]